MQVSVVYDGPIPAPIRQGNRVGTLHVTAPGVEAIDIPLLAGQSVAEKGFFGRTLAAVAHYVDRLVN
jgi:D-alanyl-D-alanine carboxypeptidase (penicillin-binding protein 5/6)